MICFNLLLSRQQQLRNLVMTLQITTKGEPRDSNVILLNGTSLLDHIEHKAAESMHAFHHSLEQSGMLPNVAIVEVCELIDCAAEGLVLQVACLQLCNIGEDIGNIGEGQLFR